MSAITATRPPRRRRAGTGVTAGVIESAGWRIGQLAGRRLYAGPQARAGLVVRPAAACTAQRAPARPALSGSGEYGMPVGRVPGMPVGPVPGMSGAGSVGSVITVPLRCGGRAGAARSRTDWQGGADGHGAGGSVGGSGRRRGRRQRPPAPPPEHYDEQHDKHGERDRSRRRDHRQGNDEPAIAVDHGNRPARTAAEVGRGRQPARPLEPGRQPARRDQCRRGVNLAEAHRGCVTASWPPPGRGDDRVHDLYGRRRGYRDLISAAMPATNADAGLVPLPSR